MGNSGGVVAEELWISKMHDHSLELEGDSSNQLIQESLINLDIRAWMYS